MSGLKRREQSPWWQIQYFRHHGWMFHMYTSLNCSCIHLSFTNHRFLCSVSGLKHGKQTSWWWIQHFHHHGWMLHMYTSLQTAYILFPFSLRLYETCHYEMKRIKYKMFALNLYWIVLILQVSWNPTVFILNELHWNIWLILVGNSQSSRCHDRVRRKFMSL